MVDSLRAGTILCGERAQAKNALAVFPNTEVTDVEVEDGAVKAVVTDEAGSSRVRRGCVRCAGAPASPRWPGPPSRSTPAVHQMIDVGPIDVLVETNNEIAYPIVRDMDTFMYERQSAGSMEVGSYAHRPIFHHPDDIPSIEESKLSPTELPFTADDFDPQLEDALELMPEILVDGRDQVRHQRPAVADPRRDAADRRDRRGEEPLVAPQRSGSRRDPVPGKPIAEWMTHGVRHRSTLTHPTSPGSTT